MSRREEYRPHNPTEKYYDWDQVERSFSYWDATAAARVPAKLPFKFLVLRQRAVIMGFTEDESKDRIFSNEVKERDLGWAEFNVRTKNYPIAKGTWKNIKDLVKKYGGSYYKVIHAVSAEGEIICIRIKGNGLLSWGNSVGTRKNEERLFDEYVAAIGFEEGDFEGRTYTYPTFAFSGPLTPSQSKKADNLHETLTKYYEFLEKEKLENQRSSPSTQPVAANVQQSAPQRSLPTPPPIELFVSEGDDDLPF
jgi:hypothetical protein